MVYGLNEVIHIPNSLKVSLKGASEIAVKQRLVRMAFWGEILCAIQVVYGLNKVIHTPELFKAGSKGDSKIVAPEGLVRMAFRGSVLSLTCCDSLRYLIV